MIFIIIIIITIIIIIFNATIITVNVESLRAEQDVWAPGRFCASACASETLSIGQSSNAYAITGTRYFHQSNFHFKHHLFHPEEIYLLRIFCINPASIFVKEGLFSSKQDTLRNNSLHPSQRWIQLPFQLHYDFFSHPASTSTLSKRPAPKRTAPKSHIPLEGSSILYTSGLKSNYNNNYPCSA